MSGNATVFSIGGVSVSASGALTGAILHQLNTLYGPGGLLAGDVVTVPGGVNNPTLPAATGPNELLLIPASDTGTISVPAGYAYVVYTGSGSVTGGGNALILGDLNYTGTAPSVVASDPTNSIASTIDGGAAAATIIVAGGAGNAITASGAGAVVDIEGNGSGTVSAPGAGDTINMTGGTYLLYALGGATLNISGGTATVQSGQAGDWLDASGNASVRFQGGKSIDTLVAHSGADTVFAGSGVVYQGGSGSDLFVAGPTSNITLTGAAQETIYGNLGKAQWDLSNSSQAAMVMGGGTDAVTLGATQATIWSYNNEVMTVGQSGSSPANSTFVDFGNNVSFDLTNSGGGSKILAWNANYGPADFTGNTTLVASNAGNDVLVLVAASEFGNSPAAAHTITVSNWQASDILDLTFSPSTNTGYTEADVASAQQQLAAGSSFTLSDGTTVVFQGAKPTTIYHI
jgi:hypothetical protein